VPVRGSVGLERHATHRRETYCGDAIAVPTNVREKADVEAMIKETVSALGGLDVLVNNAGVLRGEGLEGNHRR